MNASDPVDHGPDVSSLLINEHARFRRDMAGVLEEHDALVRRDAFEALARGLVQHETAEEEAVYPVIAKLEGGSDLRAEAVRQERELDGYLAHTMRRLVWRPQGRKSRRLIEDFSSMLDRHFAFEERSLISVVTAFEDERKRQMMGAWTQHAESFAPTRPHPHGPRHLPGLLTIGIALALVDRMRDVGRNLMRPRR